MITHFQLRQKKCFRCIYLKMPFYVKNLILFIILSTMLSIVYLLYFRADGGSVEAAMKILKGLNSNTFNYLEAHKGEVGADDMVRGFDWSKYGITTQQFFSQCVRINKPCSIYKFAREWELTKRWTTGDDEDIESSHESMLDIIGEDTIV